MKKRIFSVLLALIMLVSLVPATAISASAASYSISERAITVLKQLEGYERKCDANGYIGYGTICKKAGDHGNGNHTMSEKEADKALREELKDLDKAISTFAANNGVALNQNKHDALVVFSFQNGTAWTTGTGAFKQAVVKGMLGNDFLNAICNFRAEIADDDRRMVEANMYLNGVYSSARPSNFIRVTYDAGEMEVADSDLEDPEDDGDDDDYYNSTHIGSLNNANPIQYYDASSLPAPHLVPTMDGGIFLGWYYINEYGDNILVSTMDASFHGVTLTAGWQYFGADPDDSTTLHNAMYQMNASQLKDKNLYESPYSEKPMTALNAKGKEKDLQITGEFSIDKEFVDGENVKWGHVMSGYYKFKGETEAIAFDYYDDMVDRWVKMGDIKTNSTTTEVPDIDVTVTVTNTYVNRRERASINSAKNGSYNYGQKLRIIDTKNNDGFLWGQVATSDKDNTPVGWIALMYTDFDSAKGQNTNVNTSVAIAKAVVTYQGYVNVRSGAGTDNSIVAALANGTQVDIFEIKYVNGHQWGRCSSGWICLSYTNLTYLTEEAPDFSNDTGYISYVFNGTLLNSFRLAVREQPGLEFDPIVSWQRINPAVTVTNLTNIDGITWGKINEGWIQVSDADGYPIDVQLNTAKFTVVADTVAVRSEPNAGAERVDVLGLNVEFNVNSTYIDPDLGSEEFKQIVVIGDSVWGYANKVGETMLTYGGWVNLATKYVSRNGVTAGGADDTTVGGNTGADSTTGLGVVSNTYTGVNVRTAPGTGNPAVGKIPAGTTINIYETKAHGTSMWGRTDKGWVCMDYVTMVGDLPADVLAAMGGSTSGNGGNTTITSSQEMVFTGYTNQSDVVVYKNPSLTAEQVRVLNEFDPVTIHELLTVTEEVTTSNTDANDQNTEVVTKITSNWARVNDGYIYSPGDVLELDTLDEVVYTVNAKIAVLDAPGDGNFKFYLTTGEKVFVTSLDIFEGKMWAKVEKEDGLDKWGWVNMAGLTRGTSLENENTDNNNNNSNENGSTGNTGSTTAPSAPVVGGTGTAGSTGGATGYLYTGKIIRTNQVNVRAYASTGAAVSTTLKSGASLVIYETTISEGMAWGRCDSGWVYLYYVDLTPVTYGVVDAKVVYTEGTAIYSDASCTESIGTYSRMAIVNIYEIVGKMARTDDGWVNVDNLG